MNSEVLGFLLHQFLLFLPTLAETETRQDRLPRKPKTTELFSFCIVYVKIIARESSVDRWQLPGVSKTIYNGICSRYTPFLAIIKKA